MTGQLVSVIIPVFNGECHLQETLESVLDQTYQPMEVIVVDDGSTDGTATVAASFSRYIRYFRHDNCGHAASRNRGVAQSRGEYIAFVDADDLWSKEKNEKQIHYLEQHPDIGLCVTHIENFWSDEIPVNQRPDTGRPASMPGFVFSTLLARRGSMERVGPLKENLKHSDDTEWFMRARGMGLTVGLMQDILVFRRLHLKNRSRVFADASGNEYLELIHEKLKQMKAGAKIRP